MWCIYVGSVRVVQVRDVSVLEACVRFKQLQHQFLWPMRARTTIDSLLTQFLSVGAKLKESCVRLKELNVFGNLLPDLHQVYLAALLTCPVLVA